MAKNALDVIAESGKMPVLFIGAGISKRYLYHYPRMLYEKATQTTKKTNEQSPSTHQKHH